MAVRFRAATASDECDGETRAQPAHEGVLGEAEGSEGEGQAKERVEGDPTGHALRHRVPRAAAQYMLGHAISGALAAIATWVAFGPGPRTFSMAGSLVGRAPASEGQGRVAFGLGAVLMYGFIAVFGVVSVRRLRSRR